ncbi:putative membrane protein [Campylobacter sp. RM10537]|nr:putative membrane protein [Campylobacter sp. RM10537]
MFLAIFLFFPLKVFALDYVVFNEGVLSPKVVKEINLIGKELEEKSQIFTGVAIGDNTDFETLFNMQKELPKSYILLILSKKSHRVDIVGSKGVLNLIDKEAILSPYSGTGSILPILATQKGDIYNAAILNGYADIVDRITQARGITLNSSIGNTNRDTINILRILIYGFVCFALLYYVQRRMKGKRNG